MRTDWKLNGVSEATIPVTMLKGAWDTREWVQFYVRTKFLGSFIAFVHVLLDQVAALPKKGLQMDAHKLHAQIMIFCLIFFTAVPIVTIGECG